MDHLAGLANDEEINLFDQALQDYQGLRMDADRFTATRLQMGIYGQRQDCLLYTSPSPRDGLLSRMPSSA